MQSDFRSIKTFSNSKTKSFFLILKYQNQSRKYITFPQKLNIKVLLLKKMRK